MIEVRVTSNYREFAARLDDFGKRQLPFATSRALTATAKDALADVNSKLNSVFDRPTIFTQKAFFMKASTRADPQAFIGTRNFATKGTPAWKYLAAEQTGGERHATRYEKALAFSGGGQFAIPASVANPAVLNAYGNVNPGLVQQVLTALRGDVAASRTARLTRQGLIANSSVGRKSNFFISYDAEGNPRFVMQVIGKGQVRPVFVFPKKAPVYKPIFPFQDIVADSINHNFMAHMRREFDDAVRTAFARGKA